MSPHELDVALTFGNIHTATGLNGDTPEAHAVSRLLGATWAAFARHGDPANATIPTWPAYTAEDREVLVIGAEPRVVTNPDGAALDVAAGAQDASVSWLSVMGA